MSTPATCTFTLGGTCCNSLTDVVTFITKLKDEPLFNDKKCCDNGTSVSSNCECKEKPDAAKTCIFDTCFDWPELYKLIDDFKNHFFNRTL